MTPAETIERLVSFGARWPGTDAERRAAQYLAGELEQLGREAVIEPIRVRPAYHLTHALHSALAVVGSVVSVYEPVIGAALVLVAAASAYGDLTTRFYLVRLLMPARASQNVTSPSARSRASARVILTAHYDAARTGLVFSLKARRAQKSRRPAPRVLRRLATLAGPLDLVFWAIMAVLLAAVLRLWVGQESTLLTAVQFVPTVLLIVSVALLLDIALSDVVPGASDNASGVAAVLEVARRLEAGPPQRIDVWVVFPGAEEALMLGMREWIRRHREELDERRTFFINVDTVGNGTIRFLTGEGFVLLYRHNPRLIELSRSIAEADKQGRFGARPHIWRLGTDGVIPAMHGFPSITIRCLDEYDRAPHYHTHSDTPDRIEPEAVERAIRFVGELVRRIDRELAPGKEDVNSGPPG